MRKYAVNYCDVFKSQKVIYLVKGVCYSGEISAAAPPVGVFVEGGGSWVMMYNAHVFHMET